MDLPQYVPISTQRAEHGGPVRRGVEGHALVRRHEPRRRLGRRAKHRIHPAMLSPDRHPANASDRVSTPTVGLVGEKPVDARLEGGDLLVDGPAPTPRPS